MQVAIQGRGASYSEIAGQHYFSEKTDFTYCDYAWQAFDSVASGQSEYGIVPVENSNKGMITPVYNQQFNYAETLHIVGEVVLRVHQNLIGVPGAKIQDLTNVLSHSVALEQCSEYLDRNLRHVKRVEFEDTAGAVEKILKDGDSTVAAIASKKAATYYGATTLLAKNIHNSDNYTRFAVIAPLHANPNEDVPPNKASLVIDTGDQINAMLDSMEVFRGAQLTSFSQQPIRKQGVLFGHHFFLDVLSTGEDLARRLSRLPDFAKVTKLGEYAAATCELDA